MVTIKRYGTRSPDSVFTFIVATENTVPLFWVFSAAGQLSFRGFRRICDDTFDR